jgi:glycosyltransferase involved in cell wall biosynthesis
MKKNLLIITPIFPPRTGGPATYTWELIKRLKKQYRIKVICFSNEAVNDNEVINISISPESCFLTRQIKLLSACLKVISKSDLVYIQGPLVVGFTSAMVSWIYGKNSILKFVGDEAWESLSLSHKTVKTLEEFHSNNLLSLHSLVIFQKIAMVLASTIITPSQYLKQFLINNYHLKSGKIEVIPNAVEIQVKQRLYRRKNFIISVGRLVPHKHFEIIILAFKKLLTYRGCSKYQLIIVGEGPEDGNLKYLINRENLNNSVKLLGRKSHEEIIKLLQLAKVMVLASDYEGLSHVIIESMLMGVPVIASDIPGNKELIKHNYNGYLFGTTEDELAVALAKLLMNENIINHLTNNAKKQANEKYNWDQHLKRLIHLFGEKSS